MQINLVEKQQAELLEEVKNQVNDDEEEEVASDQD